MQHINHDTNFQFLKKKIKEIKMAMFRTEIDTELKLPNNIIQTFRVDNDGTVWFFTSCNGNYSDNIDRSFYAYLNYYKKGSGCRLQLSGVATIVENGDDGLISIDTATRMVLVKMKIMQAEYYENKVFPNVTFTEKVKSAIHQIFPTAAHRSYNFLK
ncbi:pyridoxamine 5'-phosphate oxidase family protein [Ferruginibacter sp.]